MRQAEIIFVFMNKRVEAGDDVSSLHMEMSLCELLWKEKPESLEVPDMWMSGSTVVQQEVRFESL